MCDLLNKFQKLEKIERVNLLGFNVDIVTYDQVLDKIEQFIKDGEFHKIGALNAYNIVEGRKKERYKEYINSCDIVIADGISIVWASKILNGKKIKRIPGIDLIYKLAKKASKKKWRVYFLGSRPGIAELAYFKLKKMYPGFNVVGIHHGYYKEDEEDSIVEEIKEKNPDILIVCLGLYKQEMFIKKYQQLIGVPVAMGVGGALDVISGSLKRAPKWMQEIGLEWFGRLIFQPRKVWKRYLIGNPIFIWLVLKELIRKSFSSKLL